MKEEGQAFAARACHPSLGDEAVEGSIVFEGWRLRFQSETVVLEIPLVQLDIRIEADGEVCFESPQQPDWTLRCPDQGVLRLRPLLQQTHTRNQIQACQSHTELKRRLKVTGLFFLGCIVVAFAGSIVTGVMVRSLVARIPMEWEQEFGNTVFEEMQDEYTVITNAQLQAKLERAVRPLAKALPRTAPPFTYHIVQHPLPNAFALPGGHVMVTTRLLELIDRPEELAGVVAHEMAHVTQRHAFRKIASSVGPFLIFRIFLGQGNGLMGVLGDSSAMLVNMSFSQEFELEADAVGWQYLVTAHINPRGMIDTLLKFEADVQRFKGNPGLRAFSTHPATEKRIRELEAKWKKLKDKSGFIEYETVKQ